MKKIFGWLGTVLIANNTFLPTITANSYHLGGTDQILINKNPRLNKKKNIIKRQTTIIAPLISEESDEVNNNQSEVLPDNTITNSQPAPRFDDEPGPSSQQVISGIPLASIITVHELGTLLNNSSYAIRNALAMLNPLLNPFLVKIKKISMDKEGGFWYEITAKRTNLTKYSYSGSVRVHFNVVIKSNFQSPVIIPLRDFIMNSHLGTLENSNPDTILNAIARLNPGFDQQQVRPHFVKNKSDGTSIWKIVAKRIKNSLYSGTIYVYFNSRERSNLDHKKVPLVPLIEVIRIRNLGILPYINRNIILKTLGRLNPNLNINQVSISCEVFRITNNTYSVKVQANNKSGSVSIFFNTPENITVNNLDEPQPGPSRIETNDPSDLDDKISLVSFSQFSPSQFSELCDDIDLVEEQNIAQGRTVEQEFTQDLKYVILQFNLGTLPSNDKATVLQRVQELNPYLNINSVLPIFRRIDDNQTVRWLIVPTGNSNYIGIVEVYFTINLDHTVNHVQVPTIKLENDLTTNPNHLFDQKIIKHYNSLSKEVKQEKLDEINHHFQSLSPTEKSTFQTKLQQIGTKAIAAGIIPSETTMRPNVIPLLNPPQNIGKTEIVTSSLISGGGLLGASKLTGISPVQSFKTLGNVLKNAISSPQATTLGTETGEATELTPLLSTSTAEELTITETLTTAEVTTTISEGTIIGTEAATSVALTPETLGLSLLVGGLILAGTGLLYWLFAPKQEANINNKESHYQYNMIEKYYKFLAHDQLKISISSTEWKEIKKIYQDNSTNFNGFYQAIKNEIFLFQQEDHSGWGGSITQADLKILLKIIFKHFTTIDNYFASTDKHGWKIVTNTIGSYFQIEAE